MNGNPSVITNRSAQLAKVRAAGVANRFRYVSEMTMPAKDSRSIGAIYRSCPVTKESTFTSILPSAA